MFNLVDYNRKAWNCEVDKGNPWTTPVDSAAVDAARQGHWQVLLTPTVAVPAEWFPPLAGSKVLCLAASGGQQAPIFAAAGADVTVLDNSPRQLEQDQRVAERDGLKLTLELGDMRDLSRFEANHFDLVFNPVSVVFVEDAPRVWAQAARVLKPGASLLSGHCNPVLFIFDLEAWNAGQLVVRHKIPYSDLASLPEDERQRLVIDQNEPLCFGHSLQDLIQGQITAGLILTGFYEDKSGKNDLLDPYIPAFFATRAIKPVSAG